MGMNRGQTLIATLTMVLPALPLVLLSMIPEYWGRIYFWWGMLFAILSFISVSRTIRRTVIDEASRPSTRQFFTAAVIAWLISFVVLAVINFTPLCLGQDNGDGRNNIGMCVFLTILWPVVMSVIVIPLIYLASIIAQRTINSSV
jgi:hypothetical protein